MCWSTIVDDDVEGLTPATPPSAPAATAIPVAGDPAELLEAVDGLIEGRCPSAKQKKPPPALGGGWRS
ncbi:MAG: hypothetical protein HC915_09230 [Anaerolineae bacterium]|nr:hypothetical protein [Anaerolineae bacterium]